jgi:hypothetical protein
MAVHEEDRIRPGAEIVVGDTPCRKFVDGHGTLL